MGQQKIQQPSETGRYVLGKLSLNLLRWRQIVTRQRSFIRDCLAPGSAGPIFGHFQAPEGFYMGWKWGSRSSREPFISPFYFLPACVASLFCAPHRLFRQLGCSPRLHHVASTPATRLDVHIYAVSSDLIRVAPEPRTMN